MNFQEKRTKRLRGVLKRLSRGEIMQNIQLKTLLGAEHYARYCHDCCEQTQLRKMLGYKPKEIIDYEKRLKVATFAYSKADSKSGKGHSKAASKMFGVSDTLFERLAEYLSENIVGHIELEAWFDRAVETNPENSFGLSPDSFPQIITSRSLKNMSGGYTHYIRTIREVKVDAVKFLLEELTEPEEDSIDETDLGERLQRLRKLARD